PSQRVDISNSGEPRDRVRVSLFARNRLSLIRDSCNANWPSCRRRCHGGVDSRSGLLPLQEKQTRNYRNVCGAQEIGNHQRSLHLNLDHGGASFRSGILTAHNVLLPTCIFAETGHSAGRNEESCGVMKLPKFSLLAASVMQAVGRYMLNVTFVDRRGRKFEVSDDLTFPSLEAASAEIDELANEFKIPKNGIAFRLEMEFYRDQTFH